jgi:hypothetical protein
LAGCLKKACCSSTRLKKAALKTCQRGFAALNRVCTTLEKYFSTA